MGTPKADLILEGRVNHSPTFLEKDYKFEIPIVLEDTTYVTKLPDTEFTKELRERIAATTEVFIGTARPLSILRGDRVVIYAVQDMHSTDTQWDPRRGYAIERVDVRTEKGTRTLASFFVDSDVPKTKTGHKKNY